MDDIIENDEKLTEDKYSVKDFLKTGLVLAGAMSILMWKGYVSGKLLTGLVLLDYLTTGYVRKIPLPICIIISLSLMYYSFIYLS